MLFSDKHLTNLFHQLFQMQWLYEERLIKLTSQLTSNNILSKRLLNKDTELFAYFFSLEYSDFFIRFFMFIHFQELWTIFAKAIWRLSTKIRVTSSWKIWRCFLVFLSSNKTFMFSILTSLQIWNFSFIFSKMEDENSSYLISFKRICRSVYSFFSEF